MEKVEEVVVKASRSYKPIVENNGFYFVLVSHKELDDLIGKLMHMFELNGDVEQRNALKQETKWRCRDWLDDLYQESGYDKWQGVQEDANPISLSPKITTSTTMGSETIFTPTNNQ